MIPSLGASGREMLSGVAMVEEIVRRETAVFGSLTEGKEVVDTPGIISHPTYTTAYKMSEKHIFTSNFELLSFGSLFIDPIEKRLGA